MPACASIPIGEYISYHAWVQLIHLFLTIMMLLCKCNIKYSCNLRNIIWRTNWLLNLFRYQHIKLASISYYIAVYMYIFFLLRAINFEVNVYLQTFDCQSAIFVREWRHGQWPWTATPGVLGCLFTWFPLSPPSQKNPSLNRQVLPRRGGGPHKESSTPGVIVHGNWPWHHSLLKMADWPSKVWRYKLLQSLLLFITTNI